MIYRRRPTTLHQTEERQMSSYNRPQRVTGPQMVPRTQEHTQTPVPTYAAVVQRSPPTPATVPTVQAPPPAMSDIQQQMDLQGHTMNISIPKKILPLIQLLNSLI